METLRCRISCSSLQISISSSPITQASRKPPYNITIMLQTHAYKKSFHSTILIFLNLLLLRHASATDETVMVALARALSPPTWTGSDYCNWPGVSCNNDNRVTSINLSSEHLSGTLPPEINQLYSLQSLSLQRNRLSGPIPSFANQSSLEEINLDYNNFNSTPPDFLVGLTSLQTFSINNNSNLAPWRIPTTLRDSTALTTFIASRANIIGELPDIFDSFPSLQILRLSYNAMSGSLPRSLAQSAIQNLSLNNAGFSGRIDVLRSMTQLREVWLHVNNFSGPIPDLSSNTQLTSLLLRDNILTGVIPDSLSRLPNLQIVELQNNVFQGPVPNFPRSVQVSLGTTNRFCRADPGPCDPQVTSLLAAVDALGYPMSLTDSWQGNDACDNWRFILCDSGTVTTVNFGRQNWTGTISPAFANLTGLRTLLLNDNHLYGTIPTSLTGLRQLTLLDISNNNITGRVPQFASSVTVRTSGNVLIGQDVSVNYPPGMAPPAGNEADAQSGGGSVATWIIIVPIVIAMIILGISGFFIYKRYGKNQMATYKKGMKRKGSRDSHSLMMKDIVNTEITSSNDSVRETPTRSSGDKSDYHVHGGGNVTIPIEVIREGTSNFSEDSIIGRGGFGTVYKGKLHDGTRIAVKRMESSVINDKGLNEFKAEIEVLTRVRHRHLVALHGFCDTGSERLLVYEYMPQGCLGQHLFEWRELGISPLTWNTRVSVALDVARGVEYLHSLAQQSFIHRDLKPSNILLSDDMRAKVSDFGLVKSAPDGKFSLETRLAGTFGYLAPEYAATGRVTTKVDVFAFGVILMEMITGRKALDDSLPDEKCHLVTWFRRMVLDKEAIKSELDSSLKQELNEEMFTSILKVAELAGHCTARESYQRPDMGHAVNVLSSLVEQWTPAPEKDEDDSYEMEQPMSLPQALNKWKFNEDSMTISSTALYNTNNQSSIFTMSSDSSSFDKTQ